MHLLGYLTEVVRQKAVRVGEHISSEERVQVRAGVKVFLPVFNAAVQFTHGC